VHLVEAEGHSLTCYEERVYDDGGVEHAVSDLKCLWPAGQKRRSGPPVAQCMEGTEGIVERKTPVRQVREVRERVPVVASQAMGAIPTDDEE
jgi:hypothetical protein